MKHSNPLMPVVATAGMARLHNGGHRTARAVQVWEKASASVRGRAGAVSTWLRHHLIAVVIGASTIFSAVAIFLLSYWMDEVIEYGPVLAPVLSALFTVGTAVFKALKWFRKRNRARLVARRAGAQAVRPPARRAVRPRRRPGRTAGRQSRPGKPQSRRPRRERSAGTRPRASRPRG